MGALGDDFLFQGFPNPRAKSADQQQEGAAQQQQQQQQSVSHQRQASSTASQQLHHYRSLSDSNVPLISLMGGMRNPHPSNTTTPTTSPPPSTKELLHPSLEQLNIDNLNLATPPDGSLASSVASDIIFPAPQLDPVQLGTRLSDVANERREEGKSSAKGAAARKSRKSSVSSTASTSLSREHSPPSSGFVSPSRTMRKERVRGSKRRRRKEPKKEDYASQQEFDREWQRWRRERDSNNLSVQRSRNKSRQATEALKRERDQLKIDFEAIKRQLHDARMLAVRLAFTPQEITADEYESLNIWQRQQQQMMGSSPISHHTTPSTSPSPSDQVKMGFPDIHMPILTRRPMQPHSAPIQSVPTNAPLPADLSISDVPEDFWSTIDTDSPELHPSFQPEQTDNTFFMNLLQ